MGAPPQIDMEKLHKLEETGHLFYVEGIIGAGKTTYLHRICDRLNYRKLEEPVDDNPYLRLFYYDPKTYAYEMQVYLLHRRIRIQQLAAAEALYSPDFDGAGVDRSVAGDAVFEEIHHESGNINALQHHAYLTAYRSMQLMLFPPTTLVFLDVEPACALDRIQRRSRTCEVGIPLDYLKRLDEKYKERVLRGAQEGRYPWSHATEVMVEDWNFHIPDDDHVAWQEAATRLAVAKAARESTANPEWKGASFAAWDSQRNKVIRAMEL